MNAAQQLQIFPEEKSLFDKWHEFHKANPEVYLLFQKYCFELINAGETKGSARMIMERLRWELKKTNSYDKYKINNNHIPFYARMFAFNNKEHPDFFELREKKK